MDWGSTVLSFAHNCTSTVCLVKASKQVGVVQDKLPKVGETILSGVVSDCQSATFPAVSKYFVGILS